MSTIVGLFCPQFLPCYKVPFAIVGGFAVALHGAVRGTVDIDIVIETTEKSFLHAEKALKSIGLTPRLPVSANEVFQFKDEYIEKRNLVAWTFVNSSNLTEIVDVILTQIYNKKDIEYKKVAQESIPVLSKAALIKMKRKSSRPQDLEDIKALEKIL